MSDPNPVRRLTGYELFLIENGFGIRINPALQEPFVQALTTLSTRLDASGNPSGVPVFRPPDQGAAWGYGDILHPGEDPQGALVWHCRWPQLSWNGDSLDWSQAFAASMTLQNLFSVLAYLLHERGMTNDFLVELYLTRRTFHAAPLGAYICPAFCEWLQRCFVEQTTLHEVEAIMHRVHAHIHNHPDDTFRLRDFHASAQAPSRIHLDVPGDCACFDSGGQMHYPGESIHADSHNVDSPLQQLPLLAGLIAVWERFRKESSPTA